MPECHCIYVPPVPEFTVIAPTRNRRPLLQETIASVIHQDNPNWELLDRGHHVEVYAERIPHASEQIQLGFSASVPVHYE